MSSYSEIFLTFLRLGCTSFGGPIAHIGYFHNEFVLKRKWITENAYVDLVGLCQFLPGPASSQIGMALGALRGGIPGSLLAFLGFTLPSAVLMTGLGIGLFHYGNLISPGILHGLQIAAVAVILQALWQMGTKLCPDKERLLLMIGCAMISSALGGIAGQILVIVLGGVIGYFFLKSKNLLPHNLTNFHLTKRIGSLFLFTFLLLLFLLPILNSIYTLDALDLFDRFFRIGSLVFGGGHVVLSLLEVEVVGSGIISSENFISGYGFAQGIPGPLFTISAFIGAVSNHSITGFWGAIIALLSVFLPSYLLVLGILPFWEGLRKLDAMASIMGGVNASVVGLLLATFYNPLFVQTIRDSSDFYLLGVSVILLQFWKFPSIVIVVCLALVGLIL